MNKFTYNGEEYSEVPARLLWSLSHYDGPMSGIAVSHGTYCYARCHQSIDSRATRWFWLYPLTVNEMACEEDYQALFRQYVGFHCDRDVRNKRRTEAGDLRIRSLTLFERARYFIVGDPGYHQMGIVAGVPDNRDLAYCETRKAIGFADLLGPV